MFEGSLFDNHLNGFQNENNWLYMKLWKLPLCAPQQSDMGIGGGRFITAMLYLSDVEVAPLHVLTIKLKQQSDTIQVKYKHPLSSSITATETGQYFFQSFWRPEDGQSSPSWEFQWGRKLVVSCTGISGGDDDDKKWPLHCPQGSGTLRQQLSMMDSIAWYCMVLHCIA